MEADLSLSFQHFLVKIFRIFLCAPHILALVEPSERYFSVKGVHHILPVDHLVVVSENVKVIGVSAHLKHFLERVICEPILQIFVLELIIVVGVFNGIGFHKVTNQLNIYVGLLLNIYDESFVLGV